MRATANITSSWPPLSSSSTRPTLLHDDVVDESEPAPGPQTANATFGNAASVLVGDFLYSRAFQMMVRGRRHARDERACRCDQHHRRRRGAAAHERQRPRRRRGPLPAGDPLQDRSAVRSGVPARAPSWPEPPPEIEKAAAEYGRRLGTAFQLVDDLLDYAGNTPPTSARTSATTCARVSRTLPLIFVMSHGTEAERALVREAIEQGSTERQAEVMAAVQRTGALDYTRRCAEGEAAAARAAAEKLPASAYRDALVFFAEYSVGRDR
jgi:octaprenyl-diphosphate synthase